MASFYLWFRSFHRQYDVFLAMVAYVVNIGVIYLVLNKTRRSMRAYSAIILLSCGVDIIFNTINLVGCELADVKNGVIFLFNGGFFEHAAHPWPIILTMLWLFGMLLTIVNVPMQFIYRYSILCRSQPLTLIQFCGIYSIFLFWICLHCLMCLVCLKYGSEVEIYKPYFQLNPIYAEETPEFVVGDTESLAGLLHVTNVQVMIAVSYTIIGVTGYRIYKKLDACKRDLSAGTLAAQQQLTKIMVLQAAYPFIAMAVPVSSAVLCTLFRLQFDYLGIIASFFVAIMPIANAAAIVLLVADYREAVFGRRFGKAPISTTHASQISVQQNSIVA